MTRTGELLFVVAAGLMSCSYATAQEPSEEHSVRIYDVTALTRPAVNFPFEGGIPGNEPGNNATPGAVTGGEFGGGGYGGGEGFGGGGGVGGGQFSVPPAALSQLGAVPASGGPQRQSAAADVAQLLTRMIEPASWAESGGQGECRAFGSSLLVRQTETVHQQIAHVLNDLTRAATDHGPALTLRAWWLPVPNDQRDPMERLLASAETTLALLDTCCDDVRGMRAVLRCQRDCTSHTTSGIRRNFVSAAIPSVGTGAAAHSAIVGTVNFGMTLEVTVSELFQASGADGSADSAAPRFQLTLNSTLALPVDDGIRERTRTWEIDRVMTGAHVVRTTCRISPGKPVVAGRLAVPPGQSWIDTADDLDIVFVVLLTEHEEPRP